MGLAACGGGTSKPAQVIDIDNTEINNSTVTIVQILGGVGDIPSTGGSTYATLMASLGEPQDAIQAKMRDLGIARQVWSRSLRVAPSPGGFWATGEYRVVVRNASNTNAYSLSAFASLLGQYTSPEGKHSVIPSDMAGRLESNALCLDPGESGELVFQINAPVQDILDKAQAQDLPMVENHIHALMPNDGVAWRPSVDRYAGLRVLLTQRCH